jgi:hypothetical protein
MTGAAGDNYGFALSAQPGESQRRPANNSSSQLIVRIGLPAPSCCRCLCPDGRTIRHDFEDRSRTAAPRISYPLIVPLERILRENRRRTRVVGAFPDGQSALNLAAARLRHIAGTAWSTKRYLSIELLKDQQMRGAITA